MSGVGGLWCAWQPVLRGRARGSCSRINRPGHASSFADNEHGVRSKYGPSRHGDGSPLREKRARGAVAAWSRSRGRRVHVWSRVKRASCEGLELTLIDAAFDRSVPAKSPG